MNVVSLRKATEAMSIAQHTPQKTSQVHCPRRASRTRRRGAAVVELAVVAPLLSFLALGVVEYAQLTHAAQVVSNAARRGARYAARHDTTSTTSVKSYVRDFIDDSFANLATGSARDAVGVEVVDGSGAAIPNYDLTTISSGDSVVVNVTFDFDSIRVLNHFGILNQKTLQTSTVARRE